MQASFAMEVVEGRKQLVQREIAGTAEDEHVAGAGQGCALPTLDLGKWVVQLGGKATYVV